MKLLFCLLAFFVIAVPVEASQGNPVEEFAALPAMESVRISPDGTRIALLAGPTTSTRRLAIVSLEGADPIVIDAGQDPYLVSVEWLSPDHLLLAYRQRVELRGFVFMSDEADIVRRAVFQISDGSSHELQQNERIAAVLPDDQEHVIVRATVTELGGRGRNRGGQVSQGYRYSRMSLLSGARSDLPAPPLGVDVVLDGSGEPILRMRGGRRWESFGMSEWAARRDREDLTIWSRSETGRWDVAYRENYVPALFPDAPRYPRRLDFAVVADVAGLSPDGRYAYFPSTTTGVPGEFRPYFTSAVYQLDMNTGGISGPLAESETVDVGVGAAAYLRDWRTNAIIGVTWSDDGRHVRYLDQDYADLQDRLQTLFSGAFVELSSWDRSGNRFIFHVDTADDRRGYYLFDRAEGAVELLGPSRLAGEPAVRHETRMLRFATGDGVTLVGRLTLPEDANNAAPLVVQLGDGRRNRSEREFEHFLAESGYAVLTLAYRGHGGHGQAVWLAATGHSVRWIGDDIEAAIANLPQDVRIDTDRICVAGWGFGGYLALSQNTMPGQAYACTIAIGAYAFDEAEVEWGFQGLWNSAFPEGDVPSHEIAPADRARQSNAPVFLAHCRHDVYIRFDHSARMAEALEAEGRAVSLHPLDCNVSEFRDMPYASRLELLAAVEHFLIDPAVTGATED